MIQEIPANKKPLHIINECLKRTTNSMTVYEIAEYFPICYKQASLLMNTIYDVQFDIGFIIVELVPGKDGIQPIDELRQTKTIKITLDRKYT